MISSTPMPLFSSYSASKIYTDYLSKILSIEYAQDNILVQNVVPGGVDTPLQLSTMRGNSTVVPAADFVQYALKAVGTERHTNAHPKHKLINGITKFMKAVLFEQWYDKLMLYSTSKMRDRELNRRPNRQSPTGAPHPKVGVV